MPLPSFSKIQGLAGKCWLHTTDDGIVLLVRQLTHPPSDSQRPVGCAACLLNGELVPIYVPLLMRPWVVQACHSKASRHLGHAHSANARTLLLVDLYEHVHPAVASPLPEVSSTRLTVGWLIICPCLKAWHCRRRRLLRPPPGHASRYHSHPALHRSFQPPSRHVRSHCS